MQKGSKMPKLSRALYKATQLLPPTPRVVKKEPGRQGKRLIPDEIILDIRKLHEFEGKSHRQIEQIYPQYTRIWIYNVLTYQTRGNLIPKRGTK